MHLICLLMEAGRHLQQCAAFIQGCSKGFPFLLQLAGDLLDLLGGVVTRLQESVSHRHDSVDVHIDILCMKKETRDQKEKIRDN